MTVALAILLGAMLFALLGGLAGNRTAWPLLASAGLCIVLDRYGVAFSLPLWVLIDLLVIFAIVGHRKWVDLTRIEQAIVALFGPAWVAYLLPPEPRFFGGVAVVVAQLLLTFPYARFFVRFKKTLAEVEDWLHLDLREVAV